MPLSVHCENIHAASQPMAAGWWNSPECSGCCCVFGLRVCFKVLIWKEKLFGLRFAIGLTMAGSTKATQETVMLSISGLGKTYANGVKALDDVSLEVPKGVFALPVPAVPDPRVSRLRNVRPGIPQHRTLLGGHRFRGRSAKAGAHRLRVLRYRPRARAPVVGASGGRSLHAGHDQASRRSTRPCAAFCSVLLSPGHPTRAPGIWWPSSARWPARSTRR